MGRPSAHTSEIAARICQELVEGKSLRKICEADDMPSRMSVIRWLEADTAGFRDQYARAREAQADTLAEEILEIADDGAADYRVTVGDGGTVVTIDHEHVQRSRLRVDARKWHASKLNPKKYGDRLEHAGSVGVNPFDKLSTSALADLVAALGGADGDKGSGEGGAGAPSGS